MNNSITEHEFKEQIEKIKENFEQQHQILDKEINRLEERILSRKSGITNSKTLQKKIQTTIDMLEFEYSEQQSKIEKTKKNIVKYSKEIEDLSLQLRSQEILQSNLEEEISQNEKKFLDLDFHSTLGQQTYLLENEVNLKMQIMENADKSLSETLNKKPLNVPQQKNPTKKNFKESITFLQLMMSQAKKNF
ncbi:hypothetical protein M0813_09274 [Anaeramoeba flamelloides]|uniref:Uncharacterized protein n=1 Tax=Anaeramoeba flamelloides TaxID=1746091 RepID=A0ABQ8X5B8_9EUKA|nr:hypothetical protein M0813_09274 [Anaeramoeba flamelloides]